MLNLETYEQTKIIQILYRKIMRDANKAENLMILPYWTSIIKAGRNIDYQNEYRPQEYFDRLNENKKY